MEHLVLVTDGSHAGCMEHPDNVVQLCTEWYNPISSDDGKQHGPTALNEDAVELCQHSAYSGNILIEDAIQTVDGWVYNDEDVLIDRSTHYDLPILQSRRAYHNMVRLYDGGWATTDSDNVYYGFVDRYGNTDYWLGDDENYYYNGDNYMNSDVVCGMGYDIDDWGDVCERKRYVADYGEMSDVDYSDGADVTFGIEVEKEDEDARESIDYRKLYDQTGWAKERDGSLCSSIGFEFVSPIYDLMNLKRFRDDIAKPIVRQHLNADYNKDSCGGHITISHKDYTSDELFQGLSGSFPLIYGLYPFRTKQNYCEAKSQRDMGNNPSKYSSFYRKNGRLLECRIFPAFRDVDNVLWRIELMQILIKNINKSESEYLSMLVNRKSILHRHLAKMYERAGCNADTCIMDLCGRFVEFAKKFNHVNLNAQYARIVKIVENRNNKAA